MLQIICTALRETWYGLQGRLDIPADWRMSEDSVLH
jgi:hypothetical protein